MMKGYLVVATALYCFSTLSHAIHLVKRDGPPRVVGLPIQRRQTNKPVVSNALRKRQKAVSVTLDNFEVCMIGTFLVG